MVWITPSNSLESLCVLSSRNTLSKRTSWLLPSDGTKKHNRQAEPLKDRHRDYRYQITEKVREVAIRF
ncbi:hypothetical protein EUX98_g9069 [Antrodiella citrinella]|uniref:Uncharacterized protein n=1 Tax=Antrodiella citrinella TaxID=2447956 RepID=A0A4S4M0B7_9APHY|nr:hypothetical protein EUX98_g9069 [Antrodiella citrinella]